MQMLKILHFLAVRSNNGNHIAPVRNALHAIAHHAPIRRLDAAHWFVLTVIAGRSHVIDAHAGRATDWACLLCPPSRGVSELGP